MVVSLAADEKRLRAVLREAIADALQEVREVAMQGVAGQSQINARFLARMRADLREIAADRGIKIAEDTLGPALEAMARKGWGAVEGASLGRIDPQLIDLAVSNSAVLVEDILADGIKAVNAEMAKAIIAGKPLRAIAESIRENVRLAGKDEAGIPQWRADLIARSELHSVYRQAQVKSGDELGFECFVYEGPDDDRTEPVCEQYIGETKTRAEWEEVSEREQGDSEIVFLYGLHYGCRHVLRPVPCPEGRGANVNADAEAAA